MTQAVATALVLLLMWSLKQFHWLEELGGPFTSSTVAVGFVLLTGYMAGKMAHRYKLPRITGYILVGILVGPYLLDLVSHEMTRQLQLINGLALSLIALTAGGELRLRELQPIWKSLFAITFLHVALLGVVFTGFVCLFGGWFPFLKGASWQTLLVVGSILGVLAAASSPAVAMAIINECRSEGPVTRSVLGVTVIKDIFVIILFSAVLAVGRGILEPEIPLDWAFLGVVSLEILVSLCVGILLGALIFLYLRFVNAENTLFVIGVCFICAELGLAFHLEPAIIALSAGFFMENVYAQRSDRLVHAIEQGSFPVYILFFCLAGAVLNVEALKQMWPLALILVGLRILVLMGATALGARLGRASEGMRRLGWYGFVAQAGVSLGLAAMLLRAFPDWAGPLQTLIVAIIAINQLIGPIGFRYALIRSREVC